jgi:nucleoside phosphorylase
MTQRPGPRSRLNHTAERLIGREKELELLSNAWGSGSNGGSKTNIVVIRGKGGEGKTSLVATWMAQLAADDWRGAEAVYDWSFYSQGTRDQSAATAENFIVAALRHFGDPDPNEGGFAERGIRLARLIGERQCLLVLDGLEPLQYPPGPMQGQLKDPGMAKLLKGLAEFNRGLCVVTTREKVDEIKQHYRSYRRQTVDEPPNPRSGERSYERPGTCIDHSLEFLAPPAGAELLHFSGARRSGEQTIEPDDPELQAASREAGGHALTLMLVGQYLRLMTPREFGDIRQRDCLKLAEAEAQYKTDATRPYGHAFKTIEAYEVWLSSTAVPAVSSPTNHGRDDRATESRRQLAVLRLLGLFDRPATRDCLAALRAERIEGLNEPLVDCSERDWNIALSRLAEINLVSVQSDESVDCHPLIREYFAMRLRGIGFQPVDGSENDRLEALEAYPTDEVWRAAHRRLYEHLCETTKEGDQPTLEDLQPLYQAVTHGCQAGLIQEAAQKVYFVRILRSNESHSIKKLGAFGSDLGALAAFFEMPWTTVSPSLTDYYQIWVLSTAAFNLRALGRMTEALEPMRSARELLVKDENWKAAAAQAGNLSELELTLGEVSGALSDAERSVTYADRSGDAFQRMSKRTTHADALHQSGGGLGTQPKSAAGSHSHAESLFREAEQMQAERQPAYPLLYSLQGFRYCDLLLAPAEIEAWKRCHTKTQRHEEKELSDFVPSCEILDGVKNVRERATQTLKWVETQDWLLDIALDHLTLARAALYEAILSADSSSSFILPPASFFDSAVSGLRRAGDATRLPLALLTRAWHRSLLASRTGTPARRDPADGQECPSYSDSAQSDLDEAWEIASRGSMPLFLADIHLHRARLFGEPRRVSGRVVGAFEQPDARGLTASGSQPEEYPWQSPEHDLAEARRLIEKHGYGRRIEELEDAELALKQLQKSRPVVGDVGPVRTGQPKCDSGRSEPALPDSTSPTPQAKPAPSMHHDALNLPTIVLITVNDNETDAIFDAFLGPGSQAETETRGGVDYSRLGVHGGHAIMHTICEMGAGGLGASQQRTGQAITHWQPRAVIAVGIAFGLNETRQKIGDVLISKQLQDYELGRVNEDGSVTPRGDKVSCADALLSRLRTSDTNHRRSDPDWPQNRFGLVLSGQKLVDNLDYRESLKKLTGGEAIGGEMEGGGLYVSAQAAKVDWVVIKAICDWGHDKEQGKTDA